jgi:hypothetical protein
MKIIFVAFLFITSSVFATTPIEYKVRDFAADKLVPLKQQLIQTLQTEKEKNGIEGAVTACQIQAPEIAKKLQGENAIYELGRASHRYRNPQNAPKAWMKPYFQAFLEKGEVPDVEVIKINDNRYGYMEPIFLGMPLCLQCHGTEIAEGTLKVVDELYPEDKARGFKPGEFRGIFWLEVEESAL